MFKNAKDFASAMLEGRRFKYTHLDGDVSEYFFSDGFLTIFRKKGFDKPMGMEFEDFSNKYNGVTEVIAPKWYDDIPEQGILCYADCNTVSLIVGYVPESTMPFRNNCNYGYITATPLTPEQAMQCVYKDERI